MKVELDFFKKELALAIEDRRLWIDSQHPRLSVRSRQDGGRVDARPPDVVLLPEALATATALERQGFAAGPTQIGFAPGMRAAVVPDSG
jgi:hypothetical protein